MMTDHKSGVLGSVAAGFPSPAEQYSEPPLDLNDLLVKRPAATFFLRVQGDSMIARGIFDGDLLVVDRSLTPKSGDVVVVALDGEFTVKTLRIGICQTERGPRKKFTLEPANDKYPSITIEPGHQLDLFGKVIAVIHYP